MWKVHVKLRMPVKRRRAMLEWHHRDPFDRMPIAQSLSERLVLLTVDQALGADSRLVQVAD